MLRAGTLDSSRAVNGSYGECHQEGKWLTNVHTMKADVEFTKADIKKSGSRWTGTKVTGIKGTGSMSGYLVTDELKMAVAQGLDDRKPTFKTELISKLDDPEAYGYEKVRLKGVSFDKLPAVNWTVGEVVEDEWAFTYDDLEFLNPITATDA